MTNHDAARWGVGIPPGHTATSTAGPEQPPASELLTAPKSPAPSQLPGSPTAGSNYLRQRLTSAIRDAAHAVPECNCYDGIHISIILDEHDEPMAIVSAPPEALAEVCAAAVRQMQAEADPPAIGPQECKPLRQRIAETIAAEHRRRAQARIEASPEEHAAGFADVIMAVVQPELDRRDEDLTCAVKHELQARADLNEANAKNRIHKRNAARWKERAEAAEERIANLQATLTEVTENNARLRRKAQQIGGM